MSYPARAYIVPCDVVLSGRKSEPTIIARSVWLSDRRCNVLCL